MTWLNGRNGLLVFEGVLTAQVGGSIGPGSLYSLRPRLVTRAFMDDMGVDLDITSVTPALDGGLFRITVVGTIKARTPWGTTTKDISWEVTGTPPTRITEIRDAGGPWRIEIPVEDLEFDSSVPEGYGGTPVDDAPPCRGLNVIHRLREGGTVTVTGTFLGQTATFTHVVASGDVTGVDHDCSATPEAWTRQEGGATPTLTVATTRKYCGGDLPLTTAYTFNSGPHSFSAGSGAMSVTNSNPATVTTELRCSGVVNQAWPKEFALRGRYRRWNLPGADPLILSVRVRPGVDVDVPASSGQWVLDFSQARETVTCTLDTVNGPIRIIDEVTPVYAWLKGSSLIAQGEDPSDWRCLIRGIAFRCLDLVHDGPTTLEDGNSATDWAAGANTTVSATGGAIRLVTSGGTGSATWTPGSTVKSEGYRTLRVRIRATGANRPFTAQIGSKSWIRETGAAGTYTDIDLDLCAPSGSGILDPKASRYPLSGPAGLGGVPVDSRHWGVSRIAAIALSGLADAETYEVDSITLVRKIWAKASFVPAHANWSLAWTSPSDNTYHRPSCWFDTDGRVTDQPDIYKVVPFAGATYLNRYNLTQMVTQVNALGGWTATAFGGPFPDAWHTMDREGYWAGGFGAWVDHGTDTWTSSIDVDGTSTIQVRAQMAWDQLTVPPLLGDVFARGAYPSGTSPLSARQTVLHVEKILRAHGWGLAFNGTGNPIVGATVTLTKESDGSSRGSDVTDATSVYVTEAPFAQGALPHRLEISTGGSPLSFTSVNRMRHRAVFGPGGRGQPWLLSRFPHYLHEASVAGGRVEVRTSRTNAPVGGWTHTAIVTPSTEGNMRPVLAWDPKTARLYAYWDREGSIYRAWSDSDGRTWQPEALITTGVQPMIVYDAFGTSFEGHFVFNSGTSGPGKIRTRVTTAGETPGSWSTAKNVAGGADLVVAENGFRNLTPMIDAGANRLAMSVVIDGETEPSVWWSADGGKRWKRV